MTLVGEFDLIRDLLAKVNPAAGTDDDGREDVGSGELGVEFVGRGCCWVRATTQRSSMRGDW